MEKQSKYVKIELIGQGAYGSVYKAQNPQTNQTVALKISRFEDCEEGVPSTCLRQLAILKKINHPNLVKLIDAQLFVGSNPRLEMAFQFVDYDLGKYVKIFAEQGKKGITEVSAKKIIKNILNAIYYLHDQGILHRDLKPHNILISKEGDVKIADFGLGRILPYPLDTMSREIQTLWYRAPELLLGTNNYGPAVDVWSVGCIFYELVEGRALFASTSQIGQLFEIFQALGTPRRSQWPEIVNLPDFKITFPKFDKGTAAFKKMSLQGQQWMWKLLKANPNHRINIVNALNQKYLHV